MIVKRVLPLIIALCVAGCASLDRAAGLAVVQTGHSRNIAAVAFYPMAALLCREVTMAH